MKIRIKRLYSLARAFFPRALPGTDAAHYDWATRVLATAGLPDNDSFRHKLGTIVLHLEDNVASRSDRYFITELKSAIAKQAAYNEIDRINKADKASKEVTTIVEAQVVS